MHILLTVRAPSSLPLGQSKFGLETLYVARVLVYQFQPTRPSCEASTLFLPAPDDPHALNLTHFHVVVLAVLCPTQMVNPSLSCSVILAKLRMNLALKFTNPKKLAPPQHLYSCARTTASTRDSVGPIPLLYSRYPMKVSCDILNTHFSKLRVNPF